MLNIVLPESQSTWDNIKKTLLPQAQKSIANVRTRYARQKMSLYCFAAIFLAFVVSIFMLLFSKGDKTTVACFLISGCAAVFSVAGFNAYSDLLRVNISREYAKISKCFADMQSASSLLEGSVVLCEEAALDYFKVWETPQVEALLAAINTFASLNKINDGEYLKHYYKERKVFVEYADASGTIHSCSFPAEIEYNTQIDSDQIFYKENGVVFTKKYPCDTVL